MDKLKEMKSECDKGKGDLNEDQIFAQGVGFFQAGFETSSNTMTTLMYSFAKNPKVQVSIKTESFVWHKMPEDDQIDFF